MDVTGQAPLATSYAKTYPQAALKMLKLFSIYILVMLLLLGLAIYQHVAAANLSLPISPGQTITTILLLLLGIGNAVAGTQLAKAARAYQALGRGLRLTQAVISIVLATLFFSNIPPSDVRNCMLSTVWQRLFSNHDAESLRRIQDAFNCCGYNSVRDRAWPFPNHQTARRCEEMYGRTLACGRPLRSALQRASGIEFGVVLMSAILQIAYLLLEEYFSSANVTAAPSNRITSGDAARAPLLPRSYDDAGNISDEDVADRQANNRDADEERAPWGR